MVAHHVEVVEARAAHEQAGAVLVLEGQLGDAREGFGKGAFAVVEVAVVVVGAEAAAAVGDGDQLTLASLHAPALAVAEGRVPGAGPVAGAELERAGVGYHP